ncbi:hypothetical protein BDN70DRAFT_932394 [Pholiota conissans]|uniref:Uncharacterized protein n=1 Tax=Pholiota conissans TaxID=109636 RepID=A0A9P6CUK0_9AGAR|nr:hypothetical protein BDN70DRAFT_932394 [Pholiota conissans]
MPPYPFTPKPKSTSRPEPDTTQSSEEPGPGYFEDASDFEIGLATVNLVEGNSYRILNGGPIPELPAHPRTNSSHFKGARNFKIGGGASVTSVGGHVVFVDSPSSATQPSGAYHSNNGHHSRYVYQYAEVQSQAPNSSGNGTMNPAGHTPAPVYPHPQQNYNSNYNGPPSAYSGGSSMPMPMPMPTPQQGITYQGHTTNPNIPFDGQHTPSQHVGNMSRESVRSARREVDSSPQRSRSVRDGETSSVSNTLADVEPENE